MKHRYNPDHHHRRSIRLRGYDYTQAGAYFVTMVVQGRLCLFGDVIGAEMRLNEAGEMAHRVWEALPHRFPGVEMGPSVVMPNHIHTITVLHGTVGAPLVGAQSTPNRATTRVAPTLGDVIGAYKSLTTVEYVGGVQARGWTRFRDRLWQRNYYEHIVRDDESLGRIEGYILDNPANWSLDEENPLNVSTVSEPP